MDVTRQLRKIYEAHPYPAVGGRGPRAFWCLPPRAWIEGVWRLPTPPRRILSAGCGTGNEVFALREAFPKAEIVGVDFSEHSLAIARRLARRQRLRGIRFVEGDLSDSGLGRKIGGDFDFITCHGVLAYVPRRDVALRTFAELLAPEGAVYLGVNGAAHFSTRWRSALKAFGFDADAPMPDDERLPAVVELLDTLTDDGIAPVSKREASFLPTDLFGPLIRTTSLQDFLAECESAGLHFLASQDARSPFRLAVNNESYRTLIPRSRAAVALIMDAIQPRGFHNLLLSKRVPISPPWDSPDDVAGWSPRMPEHAALSRVPRLRKSATGMRKANVRSVPMNIQVELRSPAWLLEVLRQSDGRRALGALVAESGGSMRNGTLRKHLFLLHQLYLLEMIPPAA